MNTAISKLEEADEDVKDYVVLELNNKINEGFTRIQQRIATITSTMVDNNVIQEKINEASEQLQERLTQLSTDIISIRNSLSNTSVSTQTSIQQVVDDLEELRGNLTEMQRNIAQVHINDIEEIKNSCRSIK